jgi:peptidoglycan/xylan/chitin deacetylase (PgdA/CDA1 family)
MRQGIEMRRVKLALYGAAHRTGVFSVSGRLHRSDIRIVCFHGAWVSPEQFPGDTLFIRPSTFESHLDAIVDGGYRVLPLSYVIDAIKRDRSLPRNSLAITIDDGWYGTYSIMAPALQRRRLPATLYVDTANLLSGEPVPHVSARYHQQYQLTPDVSRRSRAFAYMTPDELSRMPSFGVDVQLHTHNHTLPDDAESLRREILENRRVLAEIVGRPPDHFRHFCYPNGQTHKGCAATLASAGVDSATTTARWIASAQSNPYFLPRIMGGEMSVVEWDAELCGVASGIRRLCRISG